MNPLVSIIIPIYNSEKFIKECIESVFSQSYKNLEIVLINDGSTDNSFKICSELAKVYNNVILLNQENSGVSAARNQGIKNAKGDFLFFLDSDDLLPPTAIQSLVTSAQQTYSDLTIGKISSNEQLPIGIFEGQDFLIKVLEDNPIAYYSCRILYKSAFIKNFSFPVGFITSEDSYFVFECALKSPKVTVIDEQVYIYRVNTASISRSKFTLKKI